MSKRRSADLPLHGGRAPSWLFRRMVDMAGAIGVLIVRDSGPIERLGRLSDPLLFQAFGCVLGFDWHSSGVTTTVCGALKETAKKCGADLGLIVCGGKGGTSRKTPDEIRRACEQTTHPAETLVSASKLSAKVDSAAVQDGYQLYHHTFLFARDENAWCVVQQGMNDQARYARRYHWLSESMPSFVADPHAAVACDQRTPILNFVAMEGESHRDSMLEISREAPDRILREVRPLFKQPEMPLFAQQASPPERSELVLPPRHTLDEQDLQPDSLRKVLLKTYERQATRFEEILSEPGIGAKAVRSLSLLAELIYGSRASQRDPAAYSFAHGGKDGHPYPVNRGLYDANLERLRQAISSAKLGHTDKVESLRALAKFTASFDRR